MDVLSPTDEAQRLQDEGQRLFLQYIEHGAIDDLEGAMNALESAVEMSSDNDIKASRLSKLSEVRAFAFEAYNDAQWLRWAMETLAEAIKLVDKPAYISDMGQMWRLHFSSEETEDYAERLEELDEAVEYGRWAVEVADDGDEGLSNYLNSLALALLARFEQNGTPDGLEDLQDAIEMLQRAVELSPTDATYRCHLADVLRARFQSLDDTEDLTKAIAMSQVALDSTPDDQPNKAIYLSNHAVSLRERYERTGSIEDLEGAVAHSERAVELTADSNFDKPRWLTNLGLALRCRFEHRGEISDLDRAVFVSRSAVELASEVPGEEVELTAICQNNLSLALFARFERLTELIDLHDALEAAEEAVEFTQDISPQKAGRLMNLSTMLRARFSHSDDVNDINRSILEGRRAIEYCPDTHPDAAIYHDNLALSLHTRHDKFGDGEDLDAAVASHDNALSSTPSGHREMAPRLQNLASSLKTVYERSGEIAQLDVAIDALQQARELLPSGHADTGALLHSLGVMYAMHYANSEEEYESRLYYERALNVLKLASTDVSCSPSTRLSAAISWADLQSKREYGDPALAVPIWDYVLNSLFPLVTWLGQTIFHRLSAIGNLGTYGAPANAAAAIAIETGKLPLALEWFEQGRSLVWTQTLALRTSVDVLRESNHANLANEFERVTKSLEQASNPSRRMGDDKVRGASDYAEASAQHTLAARYEEILTEIRNIDGFGDFLRPIKFERLRRAARDGPIIIVSSHESGCNALALCSSGDIIHIPLPRFSQRLGHNLLRSIQQALGHQRGDRALVTHESQKNPTMARVLRALWLYVVQPILQVMEAELFMLAEHRTPRVTWCGAGSFSALPLHAAGIYDSSPTECIAISDFVVSSYVPNIATLLAVENRTTLSPQEISALLVVVQSKAPGFRPLPGTIQELNIIRDRFAPASPTALLDADATVSCILNAMSQHPCVHLACHGVQHSGDPLRSYFALHDGRLELADIIRTPLPHARLAFLSACQTAANYTAILDESFHLAAALLVAGFPSVVGTLWAIGDQDAPEIANEFYAALLAGEDVPRALQMAVLSLKTRVGVEEFTRWVPFVHFGS
ncbi:hypothetical protein PENSPDRAFT_349146 [Peniophora sp. CONT]|nr:hypothetical protein PENSPDRAFT_349146 [Peniophora sp. CONT]